MNHDNLFDQIDHYLSQKLTPADLLAFEDALRKNPDLASAMKQRQMEMSEQPDLEGNLPVDSEKELADGWRLLAVRDIIQAAAQEVNSEGESPSNFSEAQELTAAGSITIGEEAGIQPMLEEADERSLQLAWQDANARLRMEQALGETLSDGRQAVVKRFSMPGYTWSIAIAASFMFLWLVNIPRPSSPGFELNPKSNQGPGADSLLEARQISAEILASTLSLESFGWKLLPNEQKAWEMSLKQFAGDSVQRSIFLMKELEKTDSLSEGGGCLFSIAVSQATPWQEASQRLVQFAQTGQPGGWWIIGINAILHEDYAMADTALRILFEQYPNFPANLQVETLLGLLPPSGVGDEVE